MTASESTLSQVLDNCLQYDCEDYASIDSNININNFVLNNSCINDEGRLEMPAIWNESVVHRLPDNYKLSHSVLSSVYKKYRNSPDKLEQYDQTIKQQLKDGIIEEVQHEEVLSDPQTSYLPHNAVFKEESSSTKCRVVFSLIYVTKKCLVPSRTIKFPCLGVN